MREFGPKSLREAINEIDAKEAEEELRREAQQKLAEVRRQQQLQHFESEIRPALEEKIESFKKDPRFNGVQALIQEATELIKKEQEERDPWEPIVTINFFKPGKKNEGSPVFVFKPEKNGEKVRMVGFPVRAGDTVTELSPKKLVVRIDFEISLPREWVDLPSGSWTRTKGFDESYLFVSFCPDSGFYTAKAGSRNTFSSHNIDGLVDFLASQVRNKGYVIPEVEDAFGGGPNY